MGFPPTDQSIIQSTLPTGTKHRCAIPASAWSKPDDDVRIREYLFECYYEEDVNSFRKLCEDRGAFICAALWIPFWNVYGVVFGGKYVIMYQHTEELEMEVFT
jgi:hypothetical protein